MFLGRGVGGCMGFDLMYVFVKLGTLFEMENFKNLKVLHFGGFVDGFVLI